MSEWVSELVSEWVSEWVSECSERLRLAWKTVRRGKGEMTARREQGNAHV